MTPGVGRAEGGLTHWNKSADFQFVSRVKSRWVYTERVKVFFERVRKKENKKWILYIIIFIVSNLNNKIIFFYKNVNSI